MDLNVNGALCIKHALGIGVTHYYNICSGATYDVPWGSGDWALTILLVTLLVVIGAIFAAMGWSAFRDL